MIKVLVTGDRNWTDINPIMRELYSLPKDAIIIHGGARGVDSLAGLAAKQLGLEVRVYPAKWEIYGKSAGYIRNQEMLDAEEPDLVLAFHPDLSKSRGTKDMVNRAMLQGLPVKIITSAQPLTAVEK